MSDNRSCTCHPDEAPKPCQKRYALNECQAARIERLRAALRDISLMDKRHEHDLFSATRVAQAALEGK